MLIALPVNAKTCEVHLEGTHDAISVQHLGDRVRVLQHVTAHDGFGIKIFEQALRPITVEAQHGRVELLSAFQVLELISEYALDIKWDDASDEDTPPTVNLFSAREGGSWYSANAKSSSAEDRNLALREAATLFFDKTYTKHEVEGITRYHNPICFKE